MTERQNDMIARRLDEIAAVLAAQSANPFRVRAYRHAADTVRALAVPVSQILETHGVEGLDRLRGIGPSLARTIRDIVLHGYSPVLHRLRGETDPVHLFASVPGIGPRLAARLHDELGLETLTQLEAAAYDGRLESLAGFGGKRLDGIRDTLARRLGARAQPSDAHGGAPPPVSELLDVDREYREKAQAGLLTRIAPRKFNPRHEAWLPILHAERGDRHYTAMYSNTAHAHSLGMTNDWVVLYCDDGQREHQWTVITAAFGRLRGRRIVRGHEGECEAFYAMRPDAPPAVREETPSADERAAAHLP